jgi:Tfp pilus assembly protein PilN
MEMMVWNVVLTAIVALLGYVVKEKFAELNRISILLNKTREEVARDHITRAEFRADVQQLLDRFDRLERKIDSLANPYRGGQNAI